MKKNVLKIFKTFCACTALSAAANSQAADVNGTIRSFLSTQELSDTYTGFSRCAALYEYAANQLKWAGVDHDHPAFQFAQLYARAYEKKALEIIGPTEAEKKETKQFLKDLDAAYMPHRKTQEGIRHIMDDMHTCHEAAWN